jgi:hypothetical protein
MHLDVRVLASDGTTNGTVSTLVTCDQNALL